MAQLFNKLFWFVTNCSDCATWLPVVVISAVAQHTMLSHKRFAESITGRHCMWLARPTESTCYGNWHRSVRINNQKGDLLDLLVCSATLAPLTHWHQITFLYEGDVVLDCVPLPLLLGPATSCGESSFNLTHNEPFYMYFKSLPF